MDPGFRRYGTSLNSNLIELVTVFLIPISCFLQPPESISNHSPKKQYVNQVFTRFFLKWPFSFKKYFYHFLIFDNHAQNIGYRCGIIYSVH